ncbi:MAG: four helix bundle protein [Verrucomicrobiota bacterium]
MSAELKQRTKAFALRILRLVDAMPRSQKGRILAGQIGRSGTSVAANYRSACRARSRAGFAAKLGVAEEEADETTLWLELIAESEPLPAAKASALHRESEELTAIVASSRLTTIRTKRPSA